MKRLFESKFDKKNNNKKIDEKPTAERETSLSVDCRERRRGRKPWETKRGRSRVRDIPGNEQEGSPPEKMHYGWSPPEVEHSVAA